MINNQKSGDGSTNIQSENVTINHINNSVVLCSIEETAKKLLSSVFGELPEETKKLISINQQSYFQVLSDSLSKIIKQNDDLKKAINDPDFQFVSKIASISASRSSSTELHKNLSSLVIQRINNSDADLRRIVYNEAISTIGKLTSDQLKIITLCFLLIYTNHNIRSWETFKNYLTQRIEPFLDFKDTNAEFLHIEYTGCGSIMISSSDILEIYKQNYSCLFLKLVEKQKIDNLNLDTSVKQSLLFLDQKEQKYLIKPLNKIDLETFLKEKNVDEETSKKLTSIYEYHIKNNEEIKDEIMEVNEGKKLIEIWEKSKIKHLSLTSVGIAIAANYFEQVTGEKIDISIWIN